jgi:hypothetical protein
VHVDDARRHPLAAAVDPDRIGRIQAAADRCDAPVAHQHVGVVDAFAGAGQHRGAGDQHRLRGDRLVGARVRIVDEARGLGVGAVARRGIARHGAGAAGEQNRRERGSEWLVHGSLPVEPRT